MNIISLQQVTEKVKDLPSLPAIVMELLNDIDNEELDIHLLAQKVTNDLALTATTLRYANSAYYSTMIKVTTIQQAISLMGLATVKKIIMMAALSGCFPENNCKGFDHKAFWRHSIAVAIAARLLAKRLNLNVDAAYTAGLLHDLGALVLVTQYPRQYEASIAYRHQHQISQFEAERQVLGIDHAAVGLSLANLWNFSEVMKNAIAGHHQPDTPGLGFLATVIHVADGIAHAIGVSSTPDSQVTEVSGQSWESLDLDQTVLQELMQETAAELAQISREDL
ncbi:HDOD domain-containing protein [Undibacterium sp. Ren11W]|uniref:HDOD domain-containing protein n=1 Tax=Undibacterium sp. Ren11W TaxID=3413045 RepID=UPI003BF45930